MKEKQWYLVRTATGKEEKVRIAIENKVEALGLKDKIVEVLVPIERELRPIRGKKQIVKRKVFPGYILVNMVMEPDTWKLIKSTPGVVGFVSAGSEPLTLADEEVERIKENISREKPRISLNKGESIRVTTGPFTDLIGRVEEVNIDKGKVKVLLSIFGRETPVELDFSQIEKI
ncbi:transcription termination/antitermination factor NusG [bacterium]|nr:transcription termination/antitermination factor NusG [bacterium]